MTQPGVYFTLDAPFARIISLFSNALEDPGLISSETLNGKTNWPGVPDVQLDYLAAQLDRVRKEKYPGAVLLAMHHPPFSYFAKPKTSSSSHGTGAVHGCSPVMLQQIDTICKKAGVYPHAFLSGHAHNYQRYTRQVVLGGRELDVPFIVCGSGGHHVNTLIRPTKDHPVQEPDFNTAVDYMEFKPAIATNGLKLEKYDDHNYGFLRVTVDKQNLRIGFHRAESSGLKQSRFDLVTIDLTTHKKVAN